MSVTQKGPVNPDNQERDEKYQGNFQNMGKDGSNYTQSLIDDEEDEEDDAIALELDDDMDEEDTTEGSEDMTVEFEEDDNDEDEEDFIEEGEDMVIEANEADLANTLLDDEDDDDDL